jgi:hypothetical protein
MSKNQKTKKQFAKEQKRKEKAKKRVLNRRKVIRKDAKEKKEIERLEWKYREKQTPLRKVNVENRDGVNDVLEDVNYSVENVSVEEKDKKIVDKLKHNLEVLKALEDQYFSEQSEREELNQEFSDAGVVTMDEKMEYLKEKCKKEYDEKSLTDPTNYPPMPSENIKPVKAKMVAGADGVGKVVDIEYEKIDNEKSVKKESKGGE